MNRLFVPDMYTDDEMYRLAGCPEVQTATTLVNYVTKHLRSGELPFSGNDFSYLLNLGNMQFMYLSPAVKSVTGFLHKDFMEGRHGFLLSQVHPDDRKRLQRIYKSLFAHYFSLPMPERSRFRYSFDYRIVRSNGEAHWLLQQVSFVETDRKGSPAVSYNMCMDITAVKESSSMMFIITRVGETGSGREVSKTLLTSYPGVNLTARESEVIRLIKEGYNNSAIAAKLFISTHTVRTHRRNMLKKNGAANVPAFLNTLRMSGDLKK